MNLDSTLQIRLSSEEKQAIRQQARRAGMRSSEYVRQCALSRGSILHAQLFINELHRFGGLQQHLALRCPQHRAQLDAVTIQIKKLLADAQQVLGCQPANMPPNLDTTQNGPTR
jgi:hypothetical protein